MSGRSAMDLTLAAVALAALAFGGVLAIAPGVVPPDVADPVASLEEAVDPDRVLLGVGAVVGLFALWRSYFSGARDVRDGGAGRYGDRAARADVSVIGERTTDRVDRTLAALRRDRPADTEAVREDLRRTLRAVESTRGYAGRAADERIRRGAWTDDPIARTFLGDESAGRLSFWHRLRAWLFPGRTFERRLDRTLDELERYAAADGGTRGGRAGTDAEGARRTATDGRDAEGDDA